MMVDMDGKPLTPKQQAFVTAMLKLNNGTKAALEAGVPKKNARAQASRWMTKANIRAAIEAGTSAILAEASKEAAVDKAAVLKEIARIAFASMKSFATWGPDGITLRSSDELTEDESACVSELSQTHSETGGSIRFKLHDKLGALRDLGKHLLLFTDKLDVTSGGKVLEIREVVVRTREEAKDVLSSLPQADRVP